MAENITPKNKRSWGFGYCWDPLLSWIPNPRIPHKDKTPVKTVEDDADEELWKVGQTKKIG